jgi:hypothetical protein
MFPSQNRLGTFRRKFLLLGVFVVVGLLGGQILLGHSPGQDDFSEQVSSHDSVQANLWAISAGDQIRFGERSSPDRDRIGGVVSARLLEPASRAWKNLSDLAAVGSAAGERTLVGMNVRLQI